MDERSRCSLPPRVAGPCAGVLALRLGALAPAAAAPPHAALTAVVRWWGAAAERVPLGSGSDNNEAEVAFPLHAPPAALRRYLADAGALKIELERGGDKVGAARLPLGALAAGALEFEGELEVVAPRGGAAGALRARLRLRLDAPARPAAAAPEAAPAARRADAPAAAAAEPSAFLPDAPPVAAPLVAAPPAAKPAALTASPPPARATATLRVRVESALHLPDLKRGEGEEDESEGGDGEKGGHAAGEYYVTAVWRGAAPGARGARATTPAARAARRAAAWGVDLALEVSPVDWGVQQSGALPGPMAGPVLLLNLWRAVPLPPLGGEGGGGGASNAVAFAASAPRPSSAAPAKPGPLDALVGCAAVDLAELPALGAVGGRFPAVDAARRVRALVRASAAPSPALAAALAPLAPHAPAACTPALAPERAPAAAAPALQTAAAAATPRCAWSGSDSGSDAGAAAAGVCYEGAVSCEEEEEEAEPGGGADDEAAPRAPPAFLLGGDWAFDIGVGGAVPPERESDAFADTAAPAAPAAAPAVRRPVVFKNQLQPALAAEAHDDGGDAGGRLSGCLPAVGVPRAPPCAPGAGARPARPPAPPPVYASAATPWLFELARPGGASPAPSAGAATLASSAEPPSPALGQFSPMGGGGGASAASPTLSQVIAGVRRAALGGGGASEG
jgi:hypothetical protein